MQIYIPKIMDAKSRNFCSLLWSSPPEEKTSKDATLDDTTSDEHCRKSHLVLVIGGATHTSDPTHPLHALYMRLSEHGYVEVIVVDPTPHAEWIEQSIHRALYRLTHNQIDLDAFIEKVDPSDLRFKYNRIAVIDDVKYKATQSSGACRRRFAESIGYYALTQAAQQHPDTFTWWEIEPRAWGTFFIQIHFGHSNTDTISRISHLLTYGQRHSINCRVSSVDASSLQVRQLFCNVTRPGVGYLESII